MRYMATGVLLVFMTSAMAQLPPPSIPPLVPHPNPSSSLVLPQTPEVPVSPAPNFYPGSNLAGTNPIRHWVFFMPITSGGITYGRPNWKRQPSDTRAISPRYPSTSGACDPPDLTEWRIVK
jgi:hypothetical protein